MMMIPVHRSTLRLTHYGRRSHNVFHVTIWFTVIDEELWIGSLDGNRNWVKNLKAGGRARVDFGEGPATVSVEFIESASDNARFRASVSKKYPMLSRLIALFVRNKKPVAFRLRLAADEIGQVGTLGKL